MISTLRFGIQKVAEDPAVQHLSGETVGSEINRLLQEPTADNLLATQVKEALNNPHTIIELRSGKQVQTVAPDMPLREVLSPRTGAFEITISQPHAGG